MPTYEYRCRACDHEFERFQKMSDSHVRTCPSCKKRRVQRLISKGGGIVFKGTGFYATDYRKEPPPDRSGSGEGAGSDKGSGDAGGSGDSGSSDGSGSSGDSGGSGSEKRESSNKRSSSGDSDS